MCGEWGKSCSFDIGMYRGHAPCHRHLCQVDSSFHNRFLFQIIPGATLIGPRLVIGAAHCAKADTKFRVGAYDSTGDGHEVAIKDSIVHPKYSSNGLDHDIMLFSIEEATPHPYIKLGREEVTEGILTVLGFGSTVTLGRELSSTLQEVELEYLDNVRCDEGHGGNGDITDDMMCAWERNKDSCVGDRCVSECNNCYELGFNSYTCYSLYLHHTVVAH